MNFATIMEMLHKAHTQSTPLTEEDLQSIDVAVASNPLLKVFLQTYPPQGLHKAFERRAPNVVVADVHDPIFKAPRMVTKQWLEDELDKLLEKSNTFRPTQVTQENTPVYQKNLLAYLDRAKSLTQEQTTTLKHYIPFFFEKYKNGATGAINLFRFMDWIAIETNETERLDREQTLLGALCEASLARTGLERIFTGYDYSCMPGL
jgi:hypothetical protein